MLTQQVTSALEMYALGTISKEDLEYLLQRPFESLTKEELNFIGCTQKDYDAWLIQQQMYNEVSSTVDITMILHDITPKQINK